MMRFDPWRSPCAPRPRKSSSIRKTWRIYKSRISKIPFLRGLTALWDALGLGMRALTISANTQTGEDEKLEGPALYLTLGLALAFGIGLFFLAPAAVGQLLEHTFAAPANAGGPEAAGALAQGLASWSGWLGNLSEGILRLVLLVVYIWAVGGSLRSAGVRLSRPSIKRSTRSMQGLS
jgi:uncharacterized protein YqhQ